MSLNNGVVRKLQKVTSKEVKYLNKNFRDFKADLITFTKQ